MPGAIFLAGRGVVRLGAYPNWGYATEGVEPWMPRTRLGMKTRRLGAIGGCETRTQGVPVAGLRVRLRTQYRAAERGQAAECFVTR